MLRRWHLHRNNLRNSRKGAQETLRSYVRCRKREDSPLALCNHCDGAQWQAGVSCEVGQRFSAPVPEPLNYLSHDAPLIPHLCIITSIPWFGSLRPWMAFPRKFTQAQTCFLFWPYTLRLRISPQLPSFSALQSCHTQSCMCAHWLSPCVTCILPFMARILVQPALRFHICRARQTD